MHNQPRIFLLLMILGCGCLLLGIARNEHKIIEKKSNLVCLECIGIG